MSWGQGKDLDFYLTLDFHFLKDIKVSCSVAKAGLEFMVFLPLECFNYKMQPYAQYSSHQSIIIIIIIVIILKLHLKCVGEHNVYLELGDNLG